MSWRKAIVVLFFSVVLILTLLTGYTISTKAVEIGKRFDQYTSHYPSRIYSAPTELSLEKPFNEEDFKERLTFLGYLERKELPQKKGEYRKSETGYEVYLNDFEYGGGKFVGFPLKISIRNGRITRLTDLDTGGNLSKAQLEPELIASIYGDRMVDRTFIPLEQISPALIKAVIETEDNRFYSHWGFDLKGILRALIVNARSGTIVEGGSTITQQLVKNLFLGSERSYARKFNEVLMSVLLEIRYSKDRILEAYLNEIYLGQYRSTSIAGVEEGARFYFSKSASQLNLSEAALLAGMIRAPGAYSPFKNREDAINRRDYILQKMRERDVISQAEYEQAVTLPLPLKPHVRHTVAPHFVDYVQVQLEEEFPEEKLEAEGLRIFTTLDMGLQRRAAESIENGLKGLEKNYPYLKRRAQAGQRIQAALLSVEPQTGKILAYVGGRQGLKGDFDRVRMAKRQPGSAFKPFVYMTALDSSYTLTSIIRDEPVEVPDIEQNKNWIPKNYDDKTHGPVLLRKALEQSYNLATVRLSMDVGLSRIIRNARNAGIQSQLKPYPSIALGSFEVTPLELATAYGIFPNMGYRTEPLAILEVSTQDGRIIRSRETVRKKVIDADVAYLMNELLNGVVERGTAASAPSLGMKDRAAGKTGTTSDYRDSWFVGYTPNTLTLVWVGFDDNETTRLSGAQGALPLWSHYMGHAAALRPSEWFEAPDTIVSKPVDTGSGLLAQSYCGPSYKEFFIKGTEPKRSCSGPTEAYEYAAESPDGADAEAWDESEAARFPIVTSPPLPDEARDEEEDEVVFEEDFPPEENEGPDVVGDVRPADRDSDDGSAEKSKKKKKKNKKHHDGDD